MNIDIYDKAGVRHTPREWFIAPIHVIEAAAHMLINGEIVNYRYNADSHDIEER